MSDYKIEEHTYDVVVVGAGGAGLARNAGHGRARAENRLRDQGFPHAQHTVAAQGGIAASLSQHGPG